MTTETSESAVGASVPSSNADSPVEDSLVEALSDDQGDESMMGSGPEGMYLAGDTYTDVEFAFTYEGLVKVSLEPSGDYTEGECFFAVGTATSLSGDAFRPSFAPIFGGAVDTEQDDEFFNCDFRAVGELGYTQSSTTYMAEGETAMVWLDAIYVAPDRVGQLDGFQLYGDDELVLSAEVTQDVSG